MEDKIALLHDMVAQSDNIVFFGGAGVSTESGIPDFRSVDGLYNQKWKYPPETILSRSFFDRNPEEYYRFHREKLVIDDVKPNRVHLRLAELEREGSCARSSRRTSTGCIRPPGAKTFLSCTAASCAHTALAAASHTLRT